MSSPLQHVNPASARRMVSDLSNRRTLMWVGVALLIHLVVIVATSTGYIRDRWLDPSGAAARAQASRASQTQPAAEAGPAAQAATTTPAAPPPAARAADPADDEKAILQQRKDSPEAKKLSETAKPADIPKAPSHNGFDLDDTNLK